MNMEITITTIIATLFIVGVGSVIVSIIFDIDNVSNKDSKEIYKLDLD